MKRSEKSKVKSQKVKLPRPQPKDVKKGIFIRGIKLGIFLGIFLCSLQTINAQMTALDSCEQNFVLAWKKIEKVRDSLKTQIDGNKKLLKADSLLQLEVAKLRFANTSADSTIEGFKLREAHTEMIPLISWEGFYPNFIIGYDFTPESVIIPIVKVLKFAISTEFVFKVINRIKLVIEPLLPIGDKFRVQAKIGYRLF